MYASDQSAFGLHGGMAVISSSRLRKAWTCVALLCVPLIAAGAQVQPTEPSWHDMRASVNTPPDKPAAPALSPETRGDIYVARKMYREAIDMYRQAPQTAEIFNKIGIAFQEMLQFNLARKNYAQAIKLNHSYAEAINNLGTIYYEERFYKKAITYYKRSLKYSGPMASVYANLGAAYFARHDYNRAFSNYEEALNLDPDVLDRRNTFGTRMLERTINDMALFHLYLAKICAKQGSNERALVYLRKALEEGLKDRKKLPDVPEFSSLKKDPEFKQLLAQNPRSL